MECSERSGTDGAGTLLVQLAFGLGGGRSFFGRRAVTRCFQLVVKWLPEEAVLDPSRKRRNQKWKETLGEET